MYVPQSSNRVLEQDPYGITELSDMFKNDAGPLFRSGKMKFKQPLLFATDANRLPNARSMLATYTVHEDTCLVLVHINLNIIPGVFHCWYV